MSGQRSHLRRQIERVRCWRSRCHYFHTRFLANFESPLSIISITLGTLSGVASLVSVLALIVYFGYNLTPDDIRRLKHILRITQIIFGVSIIYDLTFYFKTTLRESRIVKWIVDLAVLISIIIWIFPDFENPWIPWLNKILFNDKFLFAVLGMYGIVELCYDISKIPNRRTNPSLMMGVSFLIFIIIGSFLLMLPRCTYHGISYIDSLFVASSSVCITGLTTVDIPSTFTPYGLIILSILIQLGSLGIITFTSFFALFFTGNTSIYNQLLLRDIIYSKSMNSLVPTLLYVLGFTLSIEIIGTLCVFFTIPDTLGLDLEHKIMFAAFHSMSSFCNAGFSYLPDGMSNPLLLNSNQVIYIITSILIFAGGIGFPILVNFKEILKNYIHKGLRQLHLVKSKALPLHIFDLNTKLVLYTTLIVLAIGTIGFFWLEYDNSLKGMSMYEKVVQSLFNSLVPRSAGFASVNPNSFLDITIILILLQMIIGGSSQSMAGGIKVNTLGVVWLNLKSVLFGHEGTSAFHRTINQVSVRRANAVVIISAFSLFIYLMIIMYLEPNLSTKSLIFETVSALFTVGSSLGITPYLNDVSKVVLSTAMFFGRVGILSVLSGLLGTRHDVSEHYPIDNVIIN